MAITAFSARSFHARLLRCAAVFSIFASTVLPAGCGRQEPVRIGFAGGISGRVADLGISGRNGAILAVETKNGSGGIHGRPVELIVRDDKQDQETAVAVDRELVGLGVDAILGHMTSSMSMAAVHVVNESTTVMVSPTTTTTYLSGNDDSFFRVTATTAEYASKMAQYLKKELGLDTVAVVYDSGNKAYTESWFDDFRKEFLSLGGRMVNVEAFRSGPGVHFYDLAVAALAPAAEGLVVIASAMDTAMICQQVRKMGSRITIAAAEWAATERLVGLGGAAVEGIIVSQFFDRENAEEGFTSFRRRYRERFGGEPGFAAVNAYDAAMVVMEAVELRKEGESLKGTILRVGTFEGIQGPVKIDRYGDAQRETFVTTIENGRFKVLK
jgi:branched-chain amino acid transport system substrate-binding protein